LQVTVELLPDTELGALVERREKDRLASAKADMTPEQIEAVIRETEELKLRQVQAGGAPAC
jgi:Zn-dependent M16 (insulinase) family peptidase